tara:strand:+ start:333 stop:494 length:162 start_codon:yes stop_codon:yes gene_type:complete
MTQEGRFKVSDADKKYKTEAWKRFESGNPAYMYVPLKKAKNKDKFKRDPSRQA